ncbi:MAG: SpoIIIAH-like family protein, partial [Oscillospiraceae bacterium]|nr:SpoIIIAH-like family protein [Oscillospiraceae bacterium]
MATYSMMETQIENLLLAKSFAECVAFISADGVTLAVPAPAEGLAVEDVAKITDTIVAETDFAATQIRIIEVKNNAGLASGTAVGDNVGTVADGSEVSDIQSETESEYSEETMNDTGDMLE